MKVVSVFIICAVCFNLLASAKPVDSDANKNDVKIDGKLDQFDEKSPAKTEENVLKKTENKENPEQPKENSERTVESKKNTEGPKEIVPEAPSIPEETPKKVDDQTSTAEQSKEGPKSNDIKRNEETTQNIEDVDETTETDKEQVPERSAKKNDVKPKKLLNRPVYYVSSKVNGRFGKSVRSFKSEGSE